MTCPKCQSESRNVTEDKKLCTGNRWWSCTNHQCGYSWSEPIVGLGEKPTVDEFGNLKEFDATANS